VREIVEMLHALVAPDVEPLFGDKSDRPRETEDVADIATSQRLSGWWPSTDLATGLESTVAWYASSFADVAQRPPRA
jgi:nucleoside-diphosphate-sugar epimerase